MHYCRYVHAFNKLHSTHIEEQNCVYGNLIFFYGRTITIDNTIVVKRMDNWRFYNSNNNEKKKKKYYKNRIRNENECWPTYRDKRLVGSFIVCK